MEDFDENTAKKDLNKLIQSANDADFPRKVKAVVYRPDYQDFVVILDNLRYCEIREKLIFDNHLKDVKDVRREILYKLKHAILLEEWQIEDMGLSGEISEEDLASAANQDGVGGMDRTQGEDYRKNIAIDDRDKYDWMDD